MEEFCVRHVEANQSIMLITIITEQHTLLLLLYVQHRHTDTLTLTDTRRAPQLRHIPSLTFSFRPQSQLSLGRPTSGSRASHNLQAHTHK